MPKKFFTPGWVFSYVCVAGAIGFGVYDKETLAIVFVVLALLTHD